MSEINNLYQEASIETLEKIKFINFAKSQNLDIVEFTNTFALELARRYKDQEYDFSFCDGVANWLMSFMTDEWFLSVNENTVPSPAWDIFLAFDQGEYHHEGDDKTIVPHKKYTLPEITKILSNENHYAFIRTRKKRAPVLWAL